MLLYTHEYGSNSPELWALSMNDPPAWSQVTVPPGGPQAPQQAILDQTRNRFVVVSNAEPGYGAGEVWELALGPPMRWRLLGASEDLLYTPAYLAYDEKRNELWTTYFSDQVVRVRLGSGHIDSSTFEVAGDEAHRSFVAMHIFDPQRQEWSGFKSPGYEIELLDTLWVLDVSGPPTWHRSPAPGMLSGYRDLFELAYDQKRHRGILYGGYDEDNRYFNDVYALTLRGIGTARRADAGAVPSTPSVTDESRVAPASGLATLDLELVGGSAGRLVTGAVTLRLSLPGTAPARLDAIDVAGRRIASQALAAGPASRAITVRLAKTGEWPAGVYFIRLRQANETRTMRVAVTR